jgi:transcription elongation GreA/GreB family factor
MNKREVFEQLLATVTDMLNGAAQGQKDAQYEANQHIGAMISRYDTFKEEAQYLAAAQQIRVTELTEAKNLLEALLGNENIFEPGDKVRVASVVTLIDDDENRLIYLLSPALGGEQFEVDGQMVTILTLTSPIAMEIRNLAVDDDVVLTLQGKKKTWYVEKIA